MAAPARDARAPSGPVDVSGGGSPRRLLAAAILASAMGFIDGSVLAIAVPAMREGLGATLAQAQWVSNAYMVALAALTLVGGALGDRFGTARAFGLGIAGFVGASLLCALAPSPGLLIAARALQGVAAALMVPGSLALISLAYPPAARGRAIGTWAAASALTTAAGPILGGLVLSLGEPWLWRTIFVVNLPLGLGALWLLRPALPLGRPRPERGLDLPGAALATLGLGLLAAGLTRAEGGALPLSLAGAGALAGFVAWEARARQPMVPLGLFRDRAFVVANLATLLLYFALSAALFYLPSLLVAGWGRTEVEAALALSPLAALIFLLSSRFGALADRVGPGPPIAGGSGLVALGFAGLGLLPEGRLWAGVLPLMAVVGLGMAMVVAPLSAAVMGGASEADGGTRSGVNNAVARVAGLLAVAAMGSLAAWAYAATGGPLSFGEVAPDGEALREHGPAMARAFLAVALVAALCAALASALAAFGLRRRP